MKMLDGHRQKNVKLQQAGSGLHRHWDVQLVIRYGHMYLCRGWEQFYRANDRWHGYFLLFKYDGDTNLYVRVFGEDDRRVGCCPEDDDRGRGLSPGVDGEGSARPGFLKLHWFLFGQRLF